MYEEFVMETWALRESVSEHEEASAAEPDSGNWQHHLTRANTFLEVANLYLEVRAGKLDMTEVAAHISARADGSELLGLETNIMRPYWVARKTVWEAARAHHHACFVSAARSRIYDL